MGHLAHRTRYHVWSALRSGKGKGSLEYLGCDIAVFRAHIEAQFQAGMTWDNHGKGDGVWQIDHIVPLKYPGADGEPPTIEEVSARLHYTNTQPMWAAENIAKGNRFVGRRVPVFPDISGSEPALVPSSPTQAPSLTDAEFDELMAEIL